MLYLTLWPVPIDPVAWQAPKNKGYVDPFAVNDLLRHAKPIDLGDHRGPEGAAFGTDRGLYVTTEAGPVLRLSGPDIRTVANVGGRPLGIAATPDGSLLIANAYLGLQQVDPDGTVTTLVDAVDEQPLVYVNSVTIAPDGKIYFTESSTKFGAREFGGTYDAALLDILEHGANGRLLVFDPDSGNADTLLTGLHYPNGVAAGSDGRHDFLVLAETANYRILKVWLNGPKSGQADVLLDNLPGFPDNVSAGLQDRFWIGLAAPRNKLLDTLSGQPLLRSVVQRLPAAMRPQAEPVSHVIAINGNGEVLMNLHDPDARVPTLTGAVETSSTIFMTTLFGSEMLVLDKRDIGR